MKRLALLGLTAAMLAALLPAAAGAAEPLVLRKEIVIAATAERVWNAWTTAEGLRPVAGTARVELRVGGPYEWFLDLEPDEHGRRGGEGCRILAFLPLEMLAFEWTFPPAIASLRAADARTQVVLRLDPTADGGVRLRFAQHGWQEGEDWQRGYAYFDRTWDWVLQTLKKTLETE